jgi:hypothetical protein
MLLWILACKPEEKESLPPEPPCGEVQSTGAAPWDPLWAQGCTDDERAAELPQTDVALEPLLYNEEIYGWRPSVDFSDGSHTVADGSHLLGTTWTTRPFGKESSFTPESVLGKVFLLEASDSGMPLSTAVATSIFPLYVQLLSAADGKATLRLVAEAEEDCEVFRDTVDLSATGMVEWSRPELEVLTTPESLYMQDSHFRFGFLGDGSEGAGFEGEAVLDVDYIDALLAEQGLQGGVCESFGGECFDCRGDGSNCARIVVYANRLIPAQKMVADELPMCGVDLEGTAGTLPPLDCDIELDLGCASVRKQLALPVLLGLGATLLRRRRRG